MLAVLDIANSGGWSMWRQFTFNLRYPTFFWTFLEYLRKNSPTEFILRLWSSQRPPANVRANIYEISR